LTQLAFAGQRSLEPPSGALRETEGSVREDLAFSGGLIAHLDGKPVAALRYRFEGGRVFIRRVAVEPGRQRRGLGRDLMAAAHLDLTRRGHRAVYVGVRKALTANLAFYEKLGYTPVEDRGNFWVLGRKL
jgi:tRNA threonylcarbamoyladenosine biosynthesis protein TsaE